MCPNCKRFVKFSQILSKPLFKPTAICYNPVKDEGIPLPDPYALTVLTKGASTMKFTFACKKISLNDSIKEYAEKKISKLDK